MFRSVRTCRSLQCAFNQVKFEWLGLVVSLVLRAGLDPPASPDEIKCSKAMALQEFSDLEGPAREFAETKGFGHLSVDINGWTLLHHAVLQSEYTRGMVEVVEGLLDVMPSDEPDRKTSGGKPVGWSA